FQGTIGRLSDKIGRKYILFFGFALSLVIPIPLIFVHNTILLIFVAIIQAFSISVIIPTWNAVQGDVTTSGFRATFIGRIASIGRIVSVAMTLLVAGVFVFIDTRYSNLITIGGTSYTITWEIQYGVSFGISAFNALLCLICVLFMKETHIVSEESKNNVPRMWIALKDKRFVKFVIVNSFFGITMSLIWPVNPIILTDIMNLDFAQVAVISSSFAVFIGITTIFGGKICDRIGCKPLIIISTVILVFFPVSMIPAIVTGKWYLLLLSRLVGGVGTGLSLVAMNTYTLDLAPDNLMGAYSGVREMFYGLATFIGSFSSGFIIDALLKTYDYNVTAISLSIGVTILRVIAGIGFLFIAEGIKSTKPLRKIVQQK
ncbi:MAG: MFS transporter, partial [Candidatus Heimdallarchaeota archaeon]